MVSGTGFRVPVARFGRFLGLRDRHSCPCSRIQTVFGFRDRLSCPGSRIRATPRFRDNVTGRNINFLRQHIMFRPESDTQNGSKHKPQSTKAYVSTRSQQDSAGSAANHQARRRLRAHKVPNILHRRFVGVITTPQSRFAGQLP